MVKGLLAHGFHPRYVLWPMLSAVALVVCAYFITEERRFVTRDLVLAMNAQKTMLVQITDTVNAIYAAESAQRGYLLTGYEAYLDPYAEAKERARLTLDKLAARRGELDPASIEDLAMIGERLAGKISEMESTIELRRSGQLPLALSFLNTDIGLTYMQDIRAAFDRLAQRQQSRIDQALVSWDLAVVSSSLTYAGMTLFTLLVIVVLGLLASREIGRRAWLTRELARQVRERTSELQAVSEQFLRVGESEKASLSRELHDELGGLLVAMKMDIAGIRRKLQSAGGDDIQVRWERLESCINAGIDLKRRVIESLRPTLLDNLGLIAALRWQAAETCAQAGVQLEIIAPDEEPVLSSEASIAIFRVVQETFTNMLKHSRADRAHMEVSVEDGEVEIRIADNGVGIGADAPSRRGSHGIMQMRFRMAAVGGTVLIEPSPEGGTRTLIRYRDAPADPR